MSKLCSHQFISFAFLLAIWTFFYIQIAFGVPTPPSENTEAKTLPSHKGSIPFQLLKIEKSLKAKYQKPGYFFMGIKSAVTCADCKRYSSIQYASTKYLRISAAKLGLVQTHDHESVDAKECIKNKDLSFLPYLFRNADKSLHFQNYYVKAQNILKAKSLPTDFKELVIAAANGRVSGRRTASFNDLVFLDVDLGQHLKLEYLPVLDMKHLKRAIKNEQQIKEIFSFQFASPQKAQQVFKFVNQLNSAIEIKVTGLLVQLLLEMQKQEEMDPDLKMLKKVKMDLNNIIDMISRATNEENDESQSNDDDLVETTSKTNPKSKKQRQGKKKA